jgi:replication initiation protein RepC
LKGEKMTVTHISTPFGGRSMTLAMAARQIDVAEKAANQDHSEPLDKWDLFRLICEARILVGVSDRSLTVLNALLTFYPGKELVEDQGMIVFPSNKQLSLRSNGMASATLRRHLAALIKQGLIIRHDSPNGKRYQRKGSYGQEDATFGFSLQPLLARASEFANMANHIRAEKVALKAIREQLTLVRRDIGKMIEMALEEGLELGQGASWSELHDQFRDLVVRIPRKADILELKPLLKEFEALRDLVNKSLENHLNSEQSSANESQSERHYHNSKPNIYFESEPASKKEVEGKSEVNQDRMKPKVRSYPLGMVLQACPQVSIYSTGGQIRHWVDLIQTTDTIRTMFGISPHAYEAAIEAMGQEQVAIVIACMLERSDKIASPGGYLRVLTKKALDHDFSVGPMLMALMRTNLEHQKNGVGVA